MFKLLKKDGRARRGKLSLKHGVVETPIFMPVGTVGCVKTLVPEDLHTLQAQIILGNTYHLFLRPGLEVIKHFGGLHSFMGWDKPILTDSGGFQIFSLSKNNKLTESGATFQSHIDGTRFELTPELAVDIQETIGSDIQMVLDECTPYTLDTAVVRESMQRSMRWAKRCFAARTKSDLKQFAIVQGGVFSEIRQESMDILAQTDFDGYAIGGLSVGEPKEDMMQITDYCTQHLPEYKPRYLMGVGTPLDLLHGVSMGVDMFDCVMPTRNGRNGTVFTSTGRLNIKNLKMKFADEPLDPKCLCYTCKTFSRGYLRHLFHASEPSIQRLLSLHNLTYYVDLMHKVRESIQESRFEAFKQSVVDAYARPSLKSS